MRRCFSAFNPSSEPEYREASSSGHALCFTQLTPFGTSYTCTTPHTPEPVLRRIPLNLYYAAYPHTCTTPHTPEPVLRRIPLNLYCATYP